MDLFDGDGILGGTSKRFRTATDGRALFYPALYGRGYVITPGKLEKRLRAGSVAFNLFCIASLFLLHWHVMVWSLVFLPAAWAVYTALNLYALRHCATTDTHAPEKRPDTIIKILLAAALLTSCLFGTLYYLNRWPSLSTLFMVFWGELLLIAAILIIFSLKTAIGKKSASAERTNATEKETKI
jgi:peptidoglycan biosynthesis protein MviN/MurJ (putative lipid II flippase)